MLSVALYEARIPMKQVFRHAHKTRGASQSVMFAVNDDEITGWGEAAPREYVTGESIDSVLAALGSRTLPEQLPKLLHVPLEEALALLTSLALPEILGKPGFPAPAAAAALETALFDFVCRHHGVAGFHALHRAGFGDVLTDEPAAIPVATVLDLGRDPIEYLTSLSSTVRERIPHVKLKAGLDVATAVVLVRQVTDLLPSATVSVDPNGAWDLDAVLAQAPRLVRAGLSWLEEPFGPRRWADLARLRQAGLQVMLDESCSTAQDLANCVAHEAGDLINLRVSKCGPLRLLALARFIRIAGLGVQLGVQVGEVGPLWATGRLIGTALRSAVAVEVGRQDEWFPPELTRPVYEVDRNASRAPVLSGPGIGLRPSAELLDRCVCHTGQTQGRAL